MNELQLLHSRLDDLIDSAYTGETGYLGFLNEAEAADAVAYLKNRGIYYALYGGCDHSDRVYICVSPYEITDNTGFPISSLRISSRGKRALSHRDYLGSLMGLRIKRECIGDIFVLSDTEAVVFLRDEISGFVLSQLTRVGNEPVKVSEFDGDVSILAPVTEELRLIVSSMRLDNVVSSCAKLSRSSSAQHIESGLVFLNGLCVSKISATVRFGDKLSIRGHGKFVISECSGNTRRDRLVIKVLHYI